MQFHYKETQNDLKMITNVSHHKDTHSGQKETETEVRVLQFIILEIMVSLGFNC